MVVGFGKHSKMRPPQRKAQFNAEEQSGTHRHVRHISEQTLHGRRTQRGMRPSSFRSFQPFTDRNTTWAFLPGRFTRLSKGI